MNLSTGSSGANPVYGPIFNGTFYSRWSPQIDTTTGQELLFETGDPNLSTEEIRNMMSLGAYIQPQLFYLSIGSSKANEVKR